MSDETSTMGSFLNAFIICVMADDEAQHHHATLFTITNHTLTFRQNSYKNSTTPLYILLVIH